MIIREGNTISIGRNFVDAATMKTGYSVTLHAMSNLTLRVSMSVADSADKAHAAVIAAVWRELTLPVTGATVQRF